jgi:enoyl-CoA hydratase
LVNLQTTVPATVTLTIDRQDRHNALDVATCERLTAGIERAVGDGARAIVLTGAGRHFCAGADLALVHGTELAVALRALLEMVATVPMPVIAAVHGAALGAGTQLAIACDLRVVDATARFGIPAAKLGLMVDHWTVQRLALLAGHGPARAMLLAAEELDADAALRLGFAQRRGDLPAAEAWARELSALAPLTLAGHKLLLNAMETSSPGRAPTAAIGEASGAGPAAAGSTDTVDGVAAAAPTGDADADAGVEAYRRAWSSADAIEGPAAFRERRAPHFEGR